MNAPTAVRSISIITPCLNGVRYVGEAIESVLAQHYCNFEHIVADGGSTDGTLEILRRYSHLKILLGPDQGVYSALNRALAVARGELIGILNSDDCYARDAFSAIGDHFAQPDMMGLAGEAVSFRGASDAGDEVARFSGAGKDLLYHATLGNPAMNAWFFQAAVFAAIGAFDASYRVAGDREFMLRLACSGLRLGQTSQLVYRYRIHPGSMTFGGSQPIWDLVGREHDRMTGDYLRKPDLPRRARDLLRRSRTRDTLRLAVRAWQRRELRSFLFYLRAGTRHDLIWPVRFAKRALSDLLERLGLRRLKRHR